MSAQLGERLIGGDGSEAARADQWRVCGSEGRMKLHGQSVRVMATAEYSCRMREVTAAAPLSPSLSAPLIPPSGLESATLTARC
jgi:hypothetical protein